MRKTLLLLSTGCIAATLCGVALLACSSDDTNPVTPGDAGTPDSERPEVGPTGTDAKADTVVNPVQSDGGDGGDAGPAPRPTSCLGGGPGCDDCGPNKNEACDIIISIPGGTWNRRNDPNFPATIKPFKLDKYEVSVGRFKKFVEAGEGVQTKTYAQHYGAVPGDNGPMAGWDTSFATYLPADTNALISDMTGGTWDQADKTYAMYGPNAFDAMLFCAWDGGFLPTEAMWLFAAEGGSENRYYPWTTNPADGGLPPAPTQQNAWFCPVGTGNAYGNWNCTVPGQDATRVWDIPGSVSKDGVFNLVGNVGEPTQDFYGKVAVGTDDAGAALYAYPPMVTPCDATQAGAVNGCPRSDPNWTPPGGTAATLNRRVSTAASWRLPDQIVVDADAGTNFYPTGHTLMSTRAYSDAVGKGTYSLRQDYESADYGFRCARQ